MKNTALPILFCLLFSQFLFAQNPPVPSPTEKVPAKLEIKEGTYLDEQPTPEPPALPPPPEPAPKPEEIFRVVEQTQEFPDGEPALLKFLYDNIKYPEFAVKQNIQGKVLVKFVVEKDGSVTDIELLQDIGGGCGAEALRVVYAMPRWNPGKPRGRLVRTKFILPVEFMLNNGKQIRPTQLKLEHEHVPAKDYGQAPKEDEIFNYAEYPPTFPGCEGMKTYRELEKCSDDKLLQIVKDNLKYPKTARRNKIEGTVFVKFVIEKDGSISNAKLMSEIGGGCGDEALRIVGKMPKWNPGKQRGQAIRYQYELPIVFSLK